MRLMFTTASASAVLIGVSAVAQGANPTTPPGPGPHRPPGTMVDTQRVEQDFQGLGLADSEAVQGHVTHGTTADGQPFLVFLSPEGELSLTPEPGPGVPEDSPRPQQ
jgi:hypothetical protein